MQSFGLGRASVIAYLFSRYEGYGTRRAGFYPAGTIWGQKRRSQAQNHFELPWTKIISRMQRVDREVTATEILDRHYWVLVVVLGFICRWQHGRIDR